MVTAVVAAAASQRVSSMMTPRPVRAAERSRQRGPGVWLRRGPRGSSLGPPPRRRQPRAFGIFDELKKQSSSSLAEEEPAEPLPDHFDLDTSILLAGFAFESYLSPEGGLLDTDVRGGSTSYLSPFVREVFAGIVEVTVVRCDKLPKADVLGKSDPYCLLSTGGGSSYRTKTKRMTLDPRWKEDEATARLYVRREERQQVLTIRVLDEDLLESDDLLGVVTVRLKDIVAAARSPLGKVKTFAGSAGEERTFELPAGHGGPGGGTVTVKMRFLPFNPPAAEMVSRGLKRAAKKMGKKTAASSGGAAKEMDARLKLAAKAAGVAAGAVAGGIDYISKESARREFEAALWTVKPEGDWAVLASQKGLQVRGRDATPHRFEKVCFVENTNTDTQAAVWRCAPDKTIVVSFRGTEMTKVKDVITDANLTPSSFSPERVGGGGVFENEFDREGLSSAAGVEDGEEAMVHGGFLAAYDSVRGRVFAAVDDIIAHTPIGGGSLDSLDEDAEDDNKKHPWLQTKNADEHYH